MPWRSRALLFALLTVVAAPAGADEPERRRRVVDLTHAFDAETLYWPTSPSRFSWRRLAWGDTEGGWFYASGAFSSPEHGGAHLLAEGDLQGVPVGVAQEGPDAHRRPVVLGALDEDPLLARTIAEAVELFGARASDAQVRHRPERVGHLGRLDQHDHEGPGAVRQPHHLGPPVHHVHVRVGLVEADAGVEVAGGQRHVGHADVAHTGSFQRGRRVRVRWYGTRTRRSPPCPSSRRSNATAGC